ncbi:MAG TPA: hypothetical protein VHV76_11080 [Mycobacteriales bacterium]|nr:hypothetical protein [Mycobacteriales bacterium]
MSSRVVSALAAGIFVVLCAAVPVAAFTHQGRADVPAARVAPLSTADRKALLAAQKLIADLPEALAEVPRAGADVAGIGPSAARATLGGSAELRPLAEAVDGRVPAVTLLEASYRALLDDRPLPDPVALSSALQTLQIVEGDVLPAVRVIALEHGRHVSAGGALDAVERDPATSALGRLLVDWQQVYGVFVLVEQAAAR